MCLRCVSPTLTCKSYEICKEIMIIHIHRNGSKNLFHKSILYRHAKISLSGQREAEPYILVGELLKEFSGLIQSFGLALCVVRDIWVYLQWIPVRGLGKSFSQRLSEVKISSHNKKIYFVKMTLNSFMGFFDKLQILLRVAKMLGFALEHVHVAYGTHHIEKIPDSL